MEKFSKEKKKDGVLPVFLWIFLVATAAVLLILTATLLSRNGTFAAWKAQYTEWKEEREAAKRVATAGEKTVHYFGPAEAMEYESWFASMWNDGEDKETEAGETVAENGAEENKAEAGVPKSDPLRELLTASPVNGGESWWNELTKLSEQVTLYAQAGAPLYRSPDKKGEVVGYGMAGEEFSLMAVSENGWYVVSDGRFYYCSQGVHYTMVQLQAVEPETLFGQPEKDKVFHEVETVLQNPELPHGCEVTGLAILLSYYGISADKCELADTWLTKGVWGQTDFNKAFVGNPRKKIASAGCFAPVIADTANRYLTEGKPLKTGEEKGQTGFSKVGESLLNSGVGKGLTAIAGEGVSLEELLVMVQEAPVLAWTTMDLQAPYIAQVWEVDGKELYWQNLEHCVVLTGYDAEKEILYGTDPLYGPCEYDIKLFSIRFQTMYSQVVQIVETAP